MELEKTKEWLKIIGYKQADNLSCVMRGDKTFFFQIDSRELIFRIGKEVTVISFSSSQTITQIASY